MVLVLPWGHIECVSPLKLLVYQDTEAERNQTQSLHLRVMVLGETLIFKQWVQGRPSWQRPQQKAMGRGSPIGLGVLEVPGKGVLSRARGVGWRIVGIKNCILHIPTQQWLTFPSSLSLSTHTYILVFCVFEPFEIRLQTSCPFTPKCFSVYFLRICYYLI